jgi:hypothetical protein
MPRPRVALIATTYFRHSHADVFATPLMEGYSWHGQHIESRVEVAGMYLEQVDPADVGLDVANRAAVPVFESVAECLALGGTGVQVDGVVLIGEHGQYGENTLGQVLYPRRRHFDSAVSAMIGAGKFVPVFTDKHFAWSTEDSFAMYDLARRLDIPLLAGSSVPLSWRIPQGADWPFGAPMEAAVAVAHGPTEGYGFHALEALQVLAERRQGGETGVRSVQLLSGDQAQAAVADGRVDPGLFGQALDAFRHDAVYTNAARQHVRDVFLVDYSDGLHGVVVLCEYGVDNFAVAARGGGEELACEMHLEPDPYRHSLFLVRAIESLMLDRAEAWPVERTLLASCVLDSAMHSRYAGGVSVETPRVQNLSYLAPEHIEDAALNEPTPADERPRFPRLPGDEG